MTPVLASCWTATRRYCAHSKRFLMRSDLQTAPAPRSCEVKDMHCKHLILASAITLSLFAIALAQPQQTRSTPTGFAIEVTYFEGRAPAYEQVRRAKLPPGEGSWFGLFRRVKEWQLPAGAQPVSAVRVVPYFDGETVKVTISVLRGEKFLDVE